ncbi:MAG: branched-chain amino acid ABC transporter substrate-binding protein [bacterium]|nr:branched-chain amino acid ABC transporter substrate-binding protein [bacterium]
MSMIARRQLVAAVLLVSLLGSVVAAVGTGSAGAQTVGDTAEAPLSVRIAARKLSNGNVEFGLRVAGGDLWLPRLRFFPYATVEVDRWLRSSPFGMSDGNDVRIRARKLANGKVEFALQVGADRQWLPRARNFPYRTAAVGRWLFASWYTVGDATAPLDTAPPRRTTVTPPGDGSLGVVRIAPGQEIQIRSLNSVSGDMAFRGLPIERSVMLAIEDYGPIRGFDVDMGAGLDSRCSYRGAEAGAQAIVADNDVVGVIGTSCSGATLAAAPLLTAAGMVLISGANTAPALTSDLAGNAGTWHSVGYYRTADNDFYQGVAMAEFVLRELGVRRAAAIHDGDGYTTGIAQAFVDAFERGGGTVTSFAEVDPDGTNVVPVLTGIASGRPGALFFPIFEPAGAYIAAQVPAVRGLEGTLLLAADGLLYPAFVSLPQTTGMYFSAPDTRVGSNRNESTGTSAGDFLATYRSRYGEPPSSPFWAHGYDATTLLLDAIMAASYLDGRTLVVDRQGVRDYLNGVTGYRGLTGNIDCDDFGDCGSSRMTIVRNIGGPANAEASLGNVVFSFAR